MLDYNNFTNEPTEEPIKTEIKGFSFSQTIDGNEFVSYEVTSPSGKLLFSTIDREEVLDYMDQLTEMYDDKHNSPSKA